MTNYMNPPQYLLSALYLVGIVDKRVEEALRRNNDLSEDEKVKKLQEAAKSMKKYEQSRSKVPRFIMSGLLSCQLKAFLESDVMVTLLGFKWCLDHRLAPTAYIFCNNVAADPQRSLHRKRSSSPTSSRGAGCCFQDDSRYFDHCKIGSILESC